MSDEIDLQAMTQSVIEKCLNLFKRFELQPDQLFKVFEQGLDFASDYALLFGVLLESPQDIQHMFLAYWQDAIG